MDGSVDFKPGDVSALRARFYILVTAEHAEGHGTLGGRSVLSLLKHSVGVIYRAVAELSPIIRKLSLGACERYPALYP